MRQRLVGLVENALGAIVVGVIVLFWLHGFDGAGVCGHDDVDQHASGVEDVDVEDDALSVAFADGLEFGFDGSSCGGVLGDGDGVCEGDLRAADDEPACYDDGMGGQYCEPQGWRW